MRYDFTHFTDELSKIKCTLNNSQLEQFELYYDMLIEKNKVMNLTAITDFDEVIEKHFLDSLFLCHTLDLNAEKNIIDVGTGAGFPGIPLKIAFPQLKITLLDSLNKRVGFLNEVIEALELNDIEAVHGRAEDFARDKEYRSASDLCVSRAVANLSTLSELCLPFVKTGGYFISYKSEKVAEEMKAAEHAISILGGKVDKQIEFTIPYSDIYRNLFVIQKCKDTPKKYPRKAGLPAKEPLV